MTWKLEKVNLFTTTIAMEAGPRPLTLIFKPSTSSSNFESWGGFVVENGRKFASESDRVNLTPLCADRGILNAHLKKNSGDINHYSISPMIKITKSACTLLFNV